MDRLYIEGLCFVEESIGFAYSADFILKTFKGEFLGKLIMMKEKEGIINDIIVAKDNSVIAFGEEGLILRFDN